MIRRTIPPILSCLLIPAAAASLACGVARADQPAPGPPPLASWGAEALAQIEKDLRVAGSDLYAESRQPNGERGNGQFGRYSFVWPAGFQLRALAAAAHVRPEAYRQRLIRFADALERYWHEADGIGGYMVLTSRSERFYDDNAWLLIGLIETWRVTREKRFLDRAKRLVPLLLDGEKKTDRAGIRQREGKAGGAFTCTTAPAAVGVLELFRITQDAEHLRMGERWYAWLTDPNVGVQDAKSGLYHQGAQWTGTRWKPLLGYRAYQSALPMQAALLLHQIKTGPERKGYLAEAQRIARAAVAKWVKPDGAFGETGQWGGSDLVDALLDLYDVDRDARWLAAVRRVLRYVHDRTRDANGRYGEYWNVDRRGRPLGECKLLYMAPVARAYWRAARYGGDLVIASDGRSEARIVVSPAAGPWEKRAAADLAHYIARMTGAKVPVLSVRGEIDAALRASKPLLVVGAEALRARPGLQEALRAKAKSKPILRSDAVVLLREGGRVYLAGNNDPSHYYAAVELLRRWGCRWFMPTEFGECIPERPVLKIGKLDHAYSPPFEVRTYWVSWLGDNTGREEFQHRNMMTGRGLAVPTGHAIGKYVKGLGKSVFSIPLTDPNTAGHVARQVEGMYAKGQSFSLGMEDGSYSSDYPRDRELMKLQWDKYMMRWSVTDAFLELYNNVARILRTKYPASRAKIGFLAYANMTIPPVRDVRAERPLFCELAPIDIDPIHGMDDPQSPPRREYKAFLYRWAKVMGGRLVVYDYDQGMLVWRDLPNPSHQAFRQDVQHYRKAGILGVNTESRNAIATTFLNLYLRARLLWNPDEDVEALLADFYRRFYGPAAEPMGRYWAAIFKAWQDTIVTEHEYFVAPAIYTPQLRALLQARLQEAEKLVAPLKRKAKPTRNEKLYLERMKFTRLSCGIIEGYLRMVEAAGTDVDYAAAVDVGTRTLALREQLTDMRGIFTTYRRYGERGYAFWPGEVRQYKELLPYTDGTRGRLVMKLPLEWAFRRDPNATGLQQRLHRGPVDLAYWNAHKGRCTPDSRKDYPAGRWELVRTDLYMQAQGVRHGDRQSYTGQGWYRSDVHLTAQQAAAPLHVRFPGLFNECWLYVNGREVAHRKQGKLWWLNDYRFEWDVDLARACRAGVNTIALCILCEHHMGGMFRRPFLYAATGTE